MITLCIAAVLLGGPRFGQVHTAPDASCRWFYLDVNLQQPGDADKAVHAIDDAAAAGYNGAVLHDISLDSLPSISPAYHAALERVMSEAKRSNIDLIPSILELDGAPILDRDPSLVESMPYRGVRFVVTNRQLKLADPPIPIVNGGFDAFAADIPTGFKGTHKDDVALFQDTAMKHGGASSLRVEGKKPNATVILTQPIVVKPWHHYRLSYFSKVVDLPTAPPAPPVGPSNIEVNAISSTGTPIGDSLWHPTPDWVRNDTAFNSQGDTNLTLSITISPAVGTKMWLDDLTITDIGLVNVTRRDDCPIHIAGDDGEVFSEVLDVAPIKDPYRIAGTGAGRFDVSHDGPIINIGNASRLQEGQIVNLDYYAAELRDGVPSICINERKAKALFKDDIKRVIALMHPRFLLFDMNWVGALGWDEACEAVGQSSGHMLARFFREMSADAKAVDPSIQIVTRDDLIDPAANAGINPLYVKGGIGGLIDGLPKDTIILNGARRDPADSLNKFAKLGFAQVLVGSPDRADGYTPIAELEKLAASIPKIKGVCCVTKAQDSAHLAEFGKEAGLKAK